MRDEKRARGVDRARTSGGGRATCGGGSEAKPRPHAIAGAIAAALLASAGFSGAAGSAAAADPAPPAAGGPRFQTGGDVPLLPPSDGMPGAGWEGTPGGLRIEGLQAVDGDCVLRRDVFVRAFVETQGDRSRVVLAFRGGVLGVGAQGTARPQRLACAMRLRLALPGRDSTELRLERTELRGGYVDPRGRGRISIRSQIQLGDSLGALQSVDLPPSPEFRSLILGQRTPLQARPRGGSIDLVVATEVETRGARDANAFVGSIELHVLER